MRGPNKVSLNTKSKQHPPHAHNKTCITKRDACEFLGHSQGTKPKHIYQILHIILDVTVARRKPTPTCTGGRRHHENVLHEYDVDMLIG